MCDRTTTQALAQIQGLIQVEQHKEAESAYQQLINQAPQVAEVWHSYGIFAYQMGRLDLAVQRMTQAAILNPSKASYQRDLCEICRQQGRVKEAVLCGIAATKLAPKDAEAHYNLGLAYFDNKAYEAAIQCYRKAIKLNPKHGFAWNNLGSALTENGEDEAAFKAQKQAIKLNPDNVEAHTNIGAHYIHQGNMQEARQYLEAAIQKQPNCFDAHSYLSTIKTYQADDPHVALLEGYYQQMLAAAKQGRQLWADDDLISLNFALAKAMDDLGRDDEAFAYYQAGNDIKHKQLMQEGYAQEEQFEVALLQQTCSLLNQDFFESRYQYWQDGDKTPIFIVGMPRSGTTLLEQILCSHASVYGAGELDTIGELVGKIKDMVYQATGKQWSFAQAFSQVEVAKIRALGQEYINSTWKLSAKSVYITDKMPGNFHYLGLIHLALPSAKIIHSMRDPMDSCFSNYSRLFKSGLHYSYNLQTLGRYYVRYAKTMQHWHQVLPAGRILDVRYEDMVANTAAEAKRVLDFIGLPWDEDCLKFYENKRVVKTASHAQVRKPIYKTSVAKWQRFAQHLQPLMDFVKDYR